jgi:hypothetical protein
METDQRVIVSVLWNEGPMLTKLHTDVRYSFMKRLIQFELSTSELASDVAVVKTFKMISTRNMSPDDLQAETLFIARATASRHLHQSFGFKLLHFHWVPLVLTNELREERNEYAKTMMPFWVGLWSFHNQSVIRHGRNVDGYGKGIWMGMDDCEHCGSVCSGE